MCWCLTRNSTPWEKRGPFSPGTFPGGLLEPSVGPRRVRRPADCAHGFTDSLVFRAFLPPTSPPKFLIPGTRLGDLTPVTSHPGPSGNSQRHFFVRNLTRGGRDGRRSAQLLGKKRGNRRGSFLLPMGDGLELAGPCGQVVDSRVPAPAAASPQRARPLPRPRTPTLIVTGLEPGQDS